jgi:hypothetical protein
MTTFGTLISPLEITSVEGISAPIAQRFPVPKAAWGYCVNTDAEWVIEGLGSPYYVSGSLTAEGNYLETTIGQIWPRG